MINQYNPQRFRLGAFGRKVGTVPVGTIFRHAILGPGTWIVDAWLNREYAAAAGNTFMAGGHLALIRSLRSGDVAKMADHHILSATD